MGGWVESLVGWVGCMDFVIYLLMVLLMAQTLAEMVNADLAADHTADKVEEDRLDSVNLIYG